MSLLNYEQYIEYTASRKPDFNNILKVLNRHCPNRPTLFEMFLNTDIYMKFSGYTQAPIDTYEYLAMQIKAFRVLGYDYCTVRASDFFLKSNANNIMKKVVL